MGRKKQVEPQPLKVEDFIFAKVRGFRAWPARILDIQDKTYHVYFYGSCNIAKVKAGQVFEYKKNKSRFGELKGKRTKGIFKEAMEQVERSRTHPSNDPDYFQVKSKFDSDKQSVVLTPKKTETLKQKSSKMIKKFVHITGDSDLE